MTVDPLQTTWKWVQFVLTSGTVAGKAVLPEEMNFAVVADWLISRYQPVAAFQARPVFLETKVVYSPACVGFLNQSEQENVPPT